MIHGIGANALAQAVAALAQLASVPVLIQSWGRETLGLWLTLVATTSLLTIADCGIMAAAGNAMVMAVARGDKPAAARLFGQVLRFVLVVGAGLGCTTVVGAAAVACGLAGSGEGLRLQVSIAVAALGLAALVSLPLGTLELGFRADGGYPAGVVLTSSVRLAETVAALMTAAAGGGMGAAATALLGVRIFGSLVTAALLRRRAPWLGLGRWDAGWREIRSLLRPAMAVLAIPTGFALSLQGTTIAAGLSLSAGAVATFVTSRTLTRAIVQALGLVTHAIMPEMATAAGRQDPRRAAALLRLNLVAALGLLLPGWMGLVVFGPALTARWTLGALRPDPTFFALMATAALLHGSWLSAANLKLAVNRQGEYAYAFVVAAAATALLVLPFSRVAGLDGVAAASLAGEAAMVVLVLPGQVRAALQAGPALEPVGSRS